jgi:hypothetical protein
LPREDERIPEVNDSKFGIQGLKSDRIKFSVRLLFYGPKRKSEGKRPLERPMRRCEDNIKMDLQGVECGGMEWLKLAQDKYR